MVAGEPFRIRLWLLLDVAHERGGQARKAGPAQLLKAVGLVDISIDSLGTLNRLPCAAVCGFPLTVCINLAAELPLLGSLLLEKGRVVQTLVLAGVGLQGVFQAEERIRGLSRLLGALRAVASKHGESSIDHGNRRRIY